MKISVAATLVTLAGSTAWTLAAPIPAPSPGIIHGVNPPPKHIRKEIKESKKFLHDFGTNKYKQVDSSIELLGVAGQAPAIYHKHGDALNTLPYAEATNELRDEHKNKLLDERLKIAEKNVQELRNQKHKGLPHAVQVHEDLKEAKKWTNEDNDPHKTVKLPLIDGKKQNNKNNKDGHEIMQKSPFSDHPTVPTKQEMEEINKILGQQKFRSENRVINKDRAVYDPVAREESIAKLKKERQRVADLVERNKPKNLKKQIEVSKAYIRTKVPKNGGGGITRGSGSHGDYNAV